MPQSDASRRQHRGPNRRKTELFSPNAWPEGIRVVRCLKCDKRHRSTARTDRICFKCREENEEIIIGEVSSVSVIE